MRIASLVLLTACGAYKGTEDGPPSDDDGPPTDAGEADTDTDSDTDADTDADTTEDTAGPGDTGLTVSGRTIGCPPDWIVTPVDYADCEASLQRRDLLAGGAVIHTDEYTYDAQGRLVHWVFWDEGYYEFVSDYVYDANGDLILRTSDADEDGSVDYRHQYTWTKDANDRPIELVDDTQDLMNGVNYRQTETWTYGACGWADHYELDETSDGVPETVSDWVDYLDGWVSSEDLDGDGVFEFAADMLLDPLTGEFLVYTEEYFLANGLPEWTETPVTFDPVDGWLLGETAVETLDFQGFPGKTYDIQRDWTYDAKGRETRYLSTWAGGATVVLDWDVSTSWSCPP